MSLEHIILGALKSPQSGYDLKRWFDEVFSFFWNADQSQIYRMIARLSEQGLVTGKAVASALGPDKRVYRSTAKGKAELRRWLRCGPVPLAQRSAIYAQLIFLAYLPDEEAAAFLDAMKSDADQMVAALEAVSATNDIEDASSPMSEDRREAFFNRACLALALARAEATQHLTNELVAAHKAAFATASHS